MSFRRFLLIGLSLALVLGCAGENEKFSSIPEVTLDGGKLQCLANAESVLTRFVQGNLPNSELAAFWNCLDTAVVKFVRYVRGKEAENYTPKELADFLDRFFLDNRGLDDDQDLIRELMEVKKLIIGGTAENITYHDLFVKTRRVIERFKAITLDLNPHMSIFSRGLAKSPKDSGLSEDQVRNAVIALKDNGKELGKLISEGGNTYSFTRAKNLLIAFEGFIQKKEPGFNFAAAKKYLPLLSELKGLLIAPPNDLIRTGDWARILDSATATLTWTMNYRFYFQKDGWGEGQGLVVLNQTVQEVFAQIELGLKSQPAERFNYSDIDRLVGTIENIGILPMDLNAATVNTIVRRLGEKILSAPGGVGAGIDRDDISVLRSEVDRWIEAQFYVSQYLSTQAPAIRGGAAELSLLLDTPWPLIRDNKGRLEFSNRVYQGKYDRRSLTTLNWQRALIRALMRGYSDQIGPDGASGLTIEQFKVLAIDWNKVAEKLGLFDVGEAEKTASKIFMEANLFMPSSNGNDHLEFNEAVQYLSYAISGLAAASELKSNFNGKCAFAGPSKRYSPACVRTELYDRREQLLGHLPLTLQFLGKEPGKWMQYLHHLEQTTRVDAGDDPFTQGEVVELMVLLQYIETFFAKYDHDGSETINVDETLEAFPVFKRSLDEIVQNSFGANMGDSDLRALFTYLFNYGSPPQSTFGGMLKFLNWRWRRDEWQYDVDRQRVVQILAELNNRR